MVSPLLSLKGELENEDDEDADLVPKLVEKLVAPVAVCARVLSSSHSSVPVLCVTTSRVPPVVVSQFVMGVCRVLVLFSFRSPTPSGMYTIHCLARTLLGPQTWFVNWWTMWTPPPM